MKPKTLLMLTSITLVVILGAVFFGQERESKPDQSGELLFPELMGHINDIREMIIETKKETVTLVREADTWSVKESGGYTAAIEKIKPVLIRMAELRIREPKTKNPDLYEKLGLLDKDAEGSSSTLITLKTEDASAAATLLLGDQRPGKGASSLSEMYVRKLEDPQTWLVTGNLPIEKSSGGWLEKELLKIASKRVQRVRVTHADGETLTVSKDTPDALDFKIEGIPKKAKVSSQFNVNNVATSLAQLQMDDVKKADEFQVDTQPGVKAVLETFDGLRVTVETMKKDEATYSKIAAAFDSALIDKKPITESSESKEPAEKKSGSEVETALRTDAKNSTKAEDEKEPESKKSVLKSEEAVRKEVAALNQKLNEWVFEIPKFRVDNFSKKKQDLLSKE